MSHRARRPLRHYSGVGLSGRDRAPGPAAIKPTDRDEEDEDHEEGVALEKTRPHEKERKEGNREKDTQVGTADWLHFGVQWSSGFDLHLASIALVAFYPPRLSWEVRLQALGVACLTNRIRLEGPAVLGEPVDRCLALAAKRTHIGAEPPAT